MECNLCPRGCNALRESPQTYGFCNAPYTATVTRAAPHFWEEPCISGTKGSGTVFFAGCNLGCLFCQNHAISRDTKVGKQVSPARLREIFLNLKATGVHNINLVTPSHYTPAILQALQGGIGLPVVFNCGGYEKVETLKRWEGKVDIYLPDMKYADPALSDKFSKAENYPSVAKAAILEMFRQVGPVETDEDGLLKKGVCIRHLILPGHTKNTLGVIEWVANTFAPGEVLFSLMSQYTPTPAVKDHPTLGRRITKREYEKCLNALWEADLDTGYVQDLSSAKEEYTPPFDLTGI